MVKKIIRREAEEDLRTTLRSLQLPGKCVLLWVLSDQSLRFSVHGGWSSGETRWLHKHAVAWGTAEVHPALDCPIVLTYRMRHNLLEELWLTSNHF